MAVDESYSFYTALRDLIQRVSTRNIAGELQVCSYESNKKDRKKKGEGTVVYFEDRFQKKRLYLVRRIKKDAIRIQLANLTERCNDGPPGYDPEISDSFEVTREEFTWYGEVDELFHDGLAVEKNQKAEKIVLEKREQLERMESAFCYG